MRLAAWQQAGSSSRDTAATKLAFDERYAMLVDAGAL